VRRIAVLLVLFGVMFALQVLRAPPVSAARDPMTLAAIGFVLLASFTLAELGSVLTLPRVTGYILAGVALGPSAANVLSQSVVQEMRMFNALALGLIATGAGLELDLGEIGRVLRTLLGTIVVKVVLGVLLVGGLFVGIGLLLPSLGLGSPSEVYATGLVLGVLSIGTSPAIALAVKTESRAKGRLMDLVLGAAVLKDLVVVICLALAVALARSLLTPGAAEDESLLILVAKELGGSLLAGSVLGALLIAYIRFVKAEMLLFVAAMILVVSEVGRSLHLELLLVFITAGFVVRNFSKYEHELMPAVQTVALPVFIVFFTIAGASVNLRSTLGILPVALALALARAVGFSVASRVGGRLGRERGLVRDRAWLGYLPQAGVTLGLVGLSAQQLPQLAEQLRTIGMAGVAINLLVGPIALKRVLKQAGESHEGAAEPASDAASDAGQTEPEPERSTQAPPVVEGALREIGDIAAELESQELADLVTELHARLSMRIDEFRHVELEPWVETIGGPLHKVLTGLGDDSEIADALHAWSEVPHADDLPRRAAACYRLFSDLQAVLRAVEPYTLVTLEASNRKRLPTDDFRVVLRKRRGALLRLFRSRRATRRVPTRLVARLTLEARLAGFSLSTLSAWSEAQALLLTDLERARQAGADREQTRAAVGSSLSRFLVNFERYARLYLLSGFEELVRSLAVAGGPALPASQIRLSEQEPIINRKLTRLRADPAAWKPVLEGKQAELRAKLEIERLVLRIRRALDQTVLRPAQASLEVASAVLSAARQRLSELRVEVASAPELSDEKRAELSARARGTCPPEAHRRLASAASRFRSAATVGSVAREIRDSIEALPRTVLVPQARSLDAEPSPSTYAVEPVALRARVEQTLIETLFPTLDEQLRQVFAEMAVTGARIREAVEICQHALDAPARGQEAEGHPAVQRAFDRALGRLDEQLRTLSQGQESATRGVGAQADAAFREIAAAFEAHPVAEGEVQRPRLARLYKRLFGRLRSMLERLMLRVRTGWARLLGSDLSRDVRLRYQRDGVDATSLHAHIARVVDVSHVPREYAKLWRAEPVREHRLFTANRETLKALLDSERSSLQGRRGSALLVGRSGSGRTSLLNLCEVELSAPRVLRPEPIEWRRSIGIIRALAIELGLGERTGDVAAALREVRTTVLIDDVEQWFTPDAHGVAELARFLALVVATDSQVFWLVAIEQSNLALLEEAQPIRPAFTHVMNIPALSVDELGRFLEARHGASQRPIVYPKTAVSKLLGRFGFGDARGVFFRMLSRSSEGNLSAAVLAWLRAARVDNHGAVTPAIYLDLRVGLSLLSHASPRQLAMLSHLVRFGPFDEAELGRYLELPEAEVARHAHFFLSAGVLQRDAGSDARLVVVPRLKPLVLGALREVGAIR
jgi:Kef-type K+ transport system membrane component KefB